MVRSHSPARQRLRAALLAAALGAGCAGNPSAEKAFSPWDKVQRILAIEFSSATARRPEMILQRMLDAPASELLRAPRLVERLGVVPEAQYRRTLLLPSRVEAALATEYERAAALGHVLTELPLPDADRIAQSTARNLAGLGFLLGLERRPLAEPTDPEHRTDPSDDHPVASWWQRLSRRLFP